MKFKISNPGVLQFFEPKKENLDFIEDLIIDILKTVKKDDIADILKFAMRELVQSAWNNNLKFIIFKINNLDITDFRDYVKGISLFKKFIENKNLDELKTLVCEKNYWIKFLPHLSRDGIRFEIISSTPLSPIEDRNLRLKLKLATRCMDFIEYYENGNYDPEDEKMGLALIIFMLKKAKIPPELFRIGNISDNFIARIEIPLSANYVPLRGRYRNQSRIFHF